MIVIRLLLLFVCIFLVQNNGIALIQFKNSTEKEINFQLNDKKYLIKSKETKDFFVVPGKHLCIWGEVNRYLYLNNGDITFINPQKSTDSPKKELQKPNEEEFNPVKQVQLKIIIPKDCSRFWIDNNLKVVEKNKYTYVFSANIDNPGKDWYYYIIKIERIRENIKNYEEKKALFRLGKKVVVDFTK